VVEEPYSGLNLVLAGSIDGQFHSDFGFFGFAFDDCFAHG
jgi:hypothetical protein